MEFSYGWRKLHGAVRSLCGAGSQLERLVDAVLFNLIHITPESDLPESVRDEFQEFMRGVGFSSAVRGGGEVQTPLRVLDEIGLNRAAEKIVGFYDAVCRHYEPH